MLHTLTSANRSLFILTALLTEIEKGYGMMGNCDGRGQRWLVAIAQVDEIKQFVER